ncbi:hypothetical protein ACFYXF_46670 [Streptomyces sp. NPDC002680]|uniref:hypothetical protein n=1 Tax=Streptomyces sp. NPDC002680 TaxID=3364659 RepID=UPI00369B033B
MGWKQVGDHTDIRLEHSGDGIAKIAVCRPEVYNAFLRRRWSRSLTRGRPPARTGLSA